MKTVVLFFSLMLVTSIAFGQKEKQYQIVANNNYIVWVENCDLSDVQKKELKTLLTDKQKALYDNRRTYKKDKAKAKELAPGIKKEYDHKIMELVGADNMVKMNEYFKSQLKPVWDFGSIE
ncbi:hypothetical protein E9993_12740 [Labilibacter sediminis]|nr:hypothetical protein E9993_12740 [Labilibacter sediminis]